MTLTPTVSVLAAMALLSAGALVAISLSFSRRLAGWFSLAVTVAAGAVALVGAGTVLAGGADTPLSFASFSIWGSTLRFAVDGLSALFIVIIAVISVIAALYSVPYMDHYREYSISRYYPWLLLFVAGMYGIVTVTDTMTFFCLFWQLMTIPSFALIRFESKKSENIRAATKYLVVMEIACLLIMAGSYLIGSGNPGHVAAHGLAPFDFEALSETVPLLNGGLLATALTLMLVGFGMKAGAWPFGRLWLPDAHPAAPSPVSALLSGVMIKTGVYGILRTLFWLVPAGTAAFSPVLWGGVIAVVGTVTLLLGTFSALRQEQTKRLLAFHSIGQVGYIILGIGAALMLLPTSGALAAGTLATIALVGALFHTVNHALFKSLLFLNAGTVLRATGTQDLNKLGGLWPLMPLTALTCLVASFSIAGVPLFNGFASKWSIYSATILAAPAAPLLAVCGLLGILTSAITLASFMKFFGVTFLSRRSALVENRSADGVKLEAPFLMQLPQVVLAAACLGLGVIPAAGYLLAGTAISTGAAGLAALLPPLSQNTVGLGGISTDGTLFMPILIGAVLGVLLLLGAGIARLGGAKRRRAEIWLCGYDSEHDLNRYGAHHLYGEVKHLFDRKH